MGLKIELPIEDNKQLDCQKEVIRILEFCQTFQGEGPNMGRYCQLLRFRVCNMANECYFCDTAVKMRTSHEMDISVERINKIVNKRGLMITGGEPTLYNHNILSILEGVDFEFCDIETNGIHLIALIKRIKENKNISSKSKNINFIYSPKIFKAEHSRMFLYHVQTLQYNSNVYYKLLCGEENKVTEDLLIMLSSHSVNKNNIYLMPMGKTHEEILKSIPKTLDLTEKYKVGISGRLHISYNFI